MLRAAAENWDCLRDHATFRSHMVPATSLAVNKAPTLLLPVILYASGMWTVTKLDLTHQQAFHMRCQRRILGMRWQDHVTNSAIHKRISQHIGQLIQAQRHSLYEHAVRLPPIVFCNQSIKVDQLI